MPALEKAATAVREQKILHRMIGEGSPPLPVLGGLRRTLTTAELAYLIGAIYRVGSKLTENRSAIPLFTLIFTPKL